jgi:fructose-1,6-bisphosphatase II / sedoheptulose-1,7-bisphosphatase
MPNDFQGNINNLIQLALNSTISAAFACQALVGMGQKNEADALAVKAMREELSKSSLLGEVVIGEGEMDEAPMLYIGERLGSGADKIFDIAVDPLEGTNLCANNKPDSITVMALGPSGSLLHAPDVYMHKLAVGKPIDKDILNFDDPLETLLKNVAKSLKKPVESLTAVFLDRPRHKEMIAKCRELGVRVSLIPDGDILGVLTTTHLGNADIYIGSGGAPEGVIAAAALKSFGGAFAGKLEYEDETSRNRAKEMLGKQGFRDINQTFTLQDMVKSEAIFAATGVTDGWLLQAPKKHDFNTVSSSLLTVYTHNQPSVSKILNYHII